jgi:hypothetical protein
MISLLRGTVAPESWLSFIKLTSTRPAAAPMYDIRHFPRHPQIAGASLFVRDANERARAFLLDS